MVSMHSTPCASRYFVVLILFFDAMKAMNFEVYPAGWKERERGNREGLKAAG